VPAARGAGAELALELGDGGIEAARITRDVLARSLPAIDEPAVQALREVAQRALRPRSDRALALPVDESSRAAQSAIHQRLLSRLN